MWVETGIIIFDITTGSLAKKSRLEVLLDDSYWPAFATDKARSLNARWDEVGEGFLKEMDFGRVRLRLNENDDGEKESIIGEFTSDYRTLEPPIPVLLLMAPRFEEPSPRSSESKRRVA